MLGLDEPQSNPDLDLLHGDRGVPRVSSGICFRYNDFITLT